MVVSEKAAPPTSLSAIYSVGRAARALTASAPLAPPRIRGAIERYEIESGRIVGWTQLCGLVGFAALYAATYSGFEVHHAIEPAPIAFTVYGAFTLWRLRASYRHSFSPASQYLSASIDIAVLYALIAAFPFQYEAPAALYLKAPTLLYVFIIIAMRALWFDPRLTLFTGAAAAFGWALLAALAGLDGAPVTSDYRVYMTSFSLLPGAELEKIGAILATTLLLALGVHRARRLLYRTATGETAATDLSKFVGRDAADRIRSSEGGIEAGDGELRRAAILMIDLRGFTAATKDVPPASVIALLKEYQARLLPVIERCGGTIDKFLGDGIMVTFGAARTTDRECAQALEAALAAAAEIDRWKSVRREQGLSPIDVGIALASGDVVYGAIGYGERLEYTVIGDAVNLAAKLEKHAKKEGARIIASNHLVETAASQGFRFTPTKVIPAALVDGMPGTLSLAIIE